jgi:hypothetical protein
VASWHVGEPRSWRRWEIALWLGILAGLAVWGAKGLLA